MKNALKFTAVLAAALLTACGGGGGGGTNAPATTPSTTPVTPVTPVVLAANLVASVPPATYTGELLTAFNLLNAERQNCGFGLVAQNSTLDASAAAHAAYTVTNGTFAHEETPGLPGFTGATPTDRMVGKGYPGSIYTTGEVMAGTSGAVLSSAGNYAVRGLLSAPYHLRALVDNYREVGLAFGTVAGGTPFVGDFGYQTATGPQLMGGSDVYTYPCNGSVGVFPELRGESPNPVPGRDLSINPIGTPVLVRVRDGNVLVVKTTSMVQVSNGAVIPLRAAVTAANDPNRANGLPYIRTNEAYFAPDAALTPNTQYQVTVTGTNNSADFSRTFIFKTGTRG